MGQTASVWCMSTCLENGIVKLVATSTIRHQLIITTVCGCVNELWLSDHVNTHTVYAQVEVTSMKCLLYFTSVILNALAMGTICTQMFTRRDRKDQCQMFLQLPIQLCVLLA